MLFLISVIRLVLLAIMLLDGLILAVYSKKPMMKDEFSTFWLLYGFMAGIFIATIPGKIWIGIVVLVPIFFIWWAQGKGATAYQEHPQIYKLIEFADYRLAHPGEYVPTYARWIVWLYMVATTIIISLATFS